MATEENSPDLGLQAEAAANRQRARSRSPRRAGTLSVEVHNVHVQQIVINVTPVGHDTDGGGHHTRFASAAMTQMEVAAGICSGMSDVISAVRQELALQFAAEALTNSLFRHSGDDSDNQSLRVLAQVPTDPSFPEGNAAVAAPSVAAIQTVAAAIQTVAAAAAPSQFDRAVSAMTDTSQCVAVQSQPVAVPLGIAGNTP